MIMFSGFGQKNVIVEELAIEILGDVLSGGHLLTYMN